MHIAREDEYEPLRMNHEFGPVAASVLNRPRSYAKANPERWSTSKLSPELQKSIALHPGDLYEVAEEFGVSRASVSRYRRKYAQPRKGGRKMESPEGSPTVQRTVPSEVVAGGTPDDEPLAAKNSQGIKDWLL